LGLKKVMIELRSSKKQVGPTAIDVLTQFQIDTYILMQNTDTRPSTTRYQKKINDI